MVPKAFKKPPVNSDESTQIANAVFEYTQQLSTNPTLTGVRVTGVALGTTPKAVPHNLGKTFTGWQILRQRNNAVVYEGTQTMPTKTVVLTASAACVVDIWFF